jgi:hypothetical protein
VTKFGKHGKRTKNNFHAERTEESYHRAGNRAELKRKLRERRTRRRRRIKLSYPFREKRKGHRKYLTE